MPVFSLETEAGEIKLSVFEVDEIRVATRRAADGSNAERATISEVMALV